MRPEPNTTDRRILKLHARGLTPEQIARKIGRPGDVARVADALALLAPPVEEVK